MPPRPELPPWGAGRAAGRRPPKPGAPGPEAPGAAGGAVVRLTVTLPLLLLPPLLLELPVLLAPLLLVVLADVSVRFNAAGPISA